MAELTVEADRDSYMDLVGPTVNYGGNSAIQLGKQFIGESKSRLDRAIGNFNVDELAGAIINSAKLVREIVTVTNGGVDATLSRCTRPADWVELEVTWDDYRSGNAWTGGGGDFDDTGPPAVITYTEASATGIHEITGLEDFVEDALDNRGGLVSIILQLADEDPDETTRFQWWSKDKGSDIWRLVIDYTLPDPGRRSIGRRPFAPGAPVIGPASAARPARTASGVAPARPRRPRRTA